MISEKKEFVKIFERFEIAQFYYNSGIIMCYDLYIDVILK